MPIAKVQVEIDQTTGEVAVKSISKYKKFREMRKDPTLALARWFAVAPSLAAGWTVEGDDQTQVDFIDANLEIIRVGLMKTALYSLFDFGWKAYEKEFEFKRTPEFGMRQWLKKLKPLKVDNTTQLRDMEGSFIGLKHIDVNTGRELYIDAAHAFFVSLDDEGLEGYGDGRMAVAEGSYDSWQVCDEGAKRFDQKVAGAHWIVYYPIGSTPLTQEDLTNGTGKDNSEIAADILKMLVASGGVTIPVDVQRMVMDLNGKSVENAGWKIVLIEAGAHQANYVTRAKYLDQLKLRAAGVTERTLTEGQYGTKAEAGEHGAVSLTIREIEATELCKLLEKYVVDQLLELNFGVKGTITVNPTPLGDERISIFTEIFKTALADPVNGFAMLEGIDLSALMEVLKIPVRQEVQVDNVDQSSTVVDPAAEVNEALPPSASITPPLEEQAQ